ncbi:MAG: pseudouridine synthase [Myxococcota bacterium]|nr:pseudouridine synthase [Myxococcota bacterium]
MKKRYILFHKPYGYLSQFTGLTGQKTLSEFGFPEGVYAAGRLDKDSEGLLLLTNDGPFKNQLLNPRSQHRKTYLVQVEGVPTAAALQNLRRGVVIKGYKTKPCQAVLCTESPDVLPRDPPIRHRINVPTRWMRITLTEGKNRQVRRMTAKVGFPTLRLIRTQIEKAQLGELASGEWCDVSRREIL